MPKEQLQGSLDEQLSVIYDVVQERMATGKYSGAVHYAKEIIKYDPNYRDIQDVLKKAQAAKRQQTILLSVSLISAILAVIIIRWLGWTQDWLSLIVAALGALLGFLITNFFFSRRT
ncbi:MAG: hypothetical protein J5I90_15440 [Caldilineales bacterium]|nr:hypothetical protein [Caldilineales bacterium]